MLSEGCATRASSRGSTGGGKETRWARPRAERHTASLREPIAAVAALDAFVGACIDPAFAPVAAGPAGSSGADAPRAAARALTAGW